MSIPNSAEKIGRAKFLDSELRELVTALIKTCPKSRTQIAQEMSLHAGQPISKRMLNDWTAQSKKPARFPAAFIEAFCEVVGNDALQRYVMGARLRKLIDFAERQLEVRELRAELLKEKKQRRRKSTPKGKRSR